ncbi:hypothetical protein ACA910_008427 [Epithemia clementina (nom. ined.)]
MPNRRTRDSAQSLASIRSAKSYAGNRTTGNGRSSRFSRKTSFTLPSSSPNRRTQKDDASSTSGLTILLPKEKSQQGANVRQLSPEAISSPSREGPSIRNQRTIDSSIKPSSPRRAPGGEDRYPNAPDYEPEGELRQPHSDEISRGQSGSAGSLRSDQTKQSITFVQPRQDDRERENRHPSALRVEGRHHLEEIFDREKHYAVPSGRGNLSPSRNVADRKRPVRAESKKSIESDLSYREIGGAREEEGDNIKLPYDRRDDRERDDYDGSVRSSSSSRHRLAARNYAIHSGSFRSTTSSRHGGSGSGSSRSNSVQRGGGRHPQVEDPVLLRPIAEQGSKSGSASSRIIHPQVHRGRNTAPIPNDAMADDHSHRHYYHRSVAQEHRDPSPESNVSGNSRSLQAESNVEPELSFDGSLVSLEQIRRANSWRGGSQVSIDYLEKESLPPDEKIERREPQPIYERKLIPYDDATYSRASQSTYSSASSFSTKSSDNRMRRSSRRRGTTHEARLPALPLEEEDTSQILEKDKLSASTFLYMAACSAVDDTGSLIASIAEYVDKNMLNGKGKAGKETKEKDKKKTIPTRKMRYQDLDSTASF